MAERNLVGRRRVLLGFPTYTFQIVDLAHDDDRRGNDEHDIRDDNHHLHNFPLTHGF